MKQIDAINEVKQAYLNIPTEVLEESDVSHLLKAIQSTISAVKNSTLNLEHNFESNPHLVAAILATVKPLIPQVLFQPRSALLKTIGRSKDENLHSDFLNSIIKETISGSILLKELGLNGKLVSSKREVRLDNIDKKLKNTELGARRIDILLETDSEILIIENKLETLESANQTSDYFNCVVKNTKKKVRGILLAPRTLEAQCSQFESLNYFQLFFILQKAHIVSPSPLLEQYLSELYDIFIKQYQPTKGSLNEV